MNPATEVSVFPTGERAVGILEQLRRTVGMPERIAVDDGPEFVSTALDAWADRNGVQLGFSRPGQSTDTALAEAFNGRLRDECLDQHRFASLEGAQQTIEAWSVDYNTERPHRALGQQTPAAVQAAWKPPREAPS